MAHPRHTRVLEDLRAQIARVERSGRARRAALPFGLPIVDELLPERGLVLGALHEVAPSGPELTHAAAAGLFAGGILARLKGPASGASRAATCSRRGSPASVSNPSACCSPKLMAATRACWP